MTISSASIGPIGRGNGDNPVDEGTGRRLVLLIEDSLAQAAAYTAYLTQAGYAVEHAPSGEQALEILARRQPDVIVLDLFLPGIEGIDVLRHMRSHGSNQPVIAITDRVSIDVAVTAIKEGAYDFVTKPFGADRIRVTVENALSHHKLTDIIETHLESYERESFHGFIGSSRIMQSVYRIIESAAKSKATIFVTGESGTGKELCAAAVHYESPRADGPFIAINCAAIPNTLMESEIFGHTKGAFTGADSARTGAAMQADGGTFFLDEICDLDLNLQAKLLRFVQTGSFRPVGEGNEISVDVRFICATNRDPLEEVKQGRFREDLYYRLHVVPVEMPPLRDRVEDIAAISRHLLRDISAQEGKTFRDFSIGAQNLLRRYHWPGNVRQLENIIRSIVVLYEGDLVTSAMIPAPVNRGSGAIVGTSVTGDDPPEALAAGGDAGQQTIRSLQEIEKEAIVKAIEACDGNVPQAATLLGVSPSTIYRKQRSWTED